MDEVVKINKTDEVESNKSDNLEIFDGHESYNSETCKVIIIVVVEDIEYEKRTKITKTNPTEEDSIVGRKS